MALNSLYCADVPLSNYSLTHRTLLTVSRSKNIKKVPIWQMV